MGAEFQIDGPLNVGRDGLQNLYTSAVKQAQYDCGHAGYTGTIAESAGLTITDKVFKSEVAAEEWLEENVKKWENTLVVLVEPEKKEPFWMWGGLYSS